MTKSPDSSVASLSVFTASSMFRFARSSEEMEETEAAASDACWETWEAVSLMAFITLLEKSADQHYTCVETTFTWSRIP